MKYLLFLASWLIVCSAFSADQYTPQEGDIVFQSLPHNEVIDAIEGCTGSPYRIAAS